MEQKARSFYKIRIRTKMRQVENWLGHTQPCLGEEVTWLGTWKLAD